MEDEEKDGLHGSEFRKLPDEILLKIVDLAAPNRVFLFNVIRRVCRKFDRIACDPSLWKGDISLYFYFDEEVNHLNTAHAQCLDSIFDRLLNDKGLSHISHMTSTKSMFSHHHTVPGSR